MIQQVQIKHAAEFMNCLKRPGINVPSLHAWSYVLTKKKEKNIWSVVGTQD